MTAENTDAAIVVTSGNFTAEARDFAAGKPIQLLDGPQLLALIQSVQTGTAATVTADTRGAETATAPACPLCGRPMVMRTARRGANVGSQFWGCPAYPACKGTRAAQPS